ncbi:monosaccharide-transporting ATPase [Spirochaetia bacterium]|nr:monosaccharide-transporting ATPase [Spirochaetia bacterium]
MSDSVLLQMKDIHKRFPGVYALKGTNFDLKAGEVHALLGENGAGKSTLINILGGIYRSDGGEVFLDGRKIEVSSVKSAQDLGIRIIHQELVLSPYTSIAENVYLGNEPMKGRFVDFKTMNEETRKLLNAFGIKRKATEIISSLTVAEQQLVEIIKAISFNPKIIAMDEPTSSLSDKECDVLFDKIRFLKDQGIGIIYISHRMSELERIADRVTVMRDAKDVATKRMDETTTDELITLMVGREISSFYTRDYCMSDEVVLDVHNITTEYIRNVSFTLHRGEILGFSGLMGAGRTETMRALFGIDRILSGEVFLNNEKLQIKNVADAMRKGISYVPEDRRGRGIIPDQSIKFNITLKVLYEFIKGVFVNNGKEQEISDTYFTGLAVRAPNTAALIKNLSGGNQQKVVVASWLATKPRVLIFDEPTRGIDIGAKTEMYAIMNKLAKEGMAIIMVSSELPEILNMSDRIAVMREGTLSGILDRSEATQETIMQKSVVM